MYVKSSQIWIMDLGKNKGHEQNGKRPCFVLKASRKEKTCIIIPGSRTKRKGSFIYKDFNWLPHQIRNVDEQRRLRKVQTFTSNDYSVMIRKFINYLVK